MTDPADRPPETAPSPPATTLAEARAAVVGNRYLLFEDSFRLFDSAGGFRPTFTWQALIFDVLWFIYRRMYLEAVLAFLAVLVLTSLGALVSGNAGLVLFMGLGFRLALAVTGRWFYWKAVDRRLEQAMRRYPDDPDRALTWLKLKGGVDPLAVILIFAVQLVIGFWLGSINKVGL